MRCCFLGGDAGLDFGDGRGWIGGLFEETRRADALFEALGVVSHLRVKGERRRMGEPCFRG